MSQTLLQPGPHAGPTAPSAPPGAGPSTVAVVGLGYVGLPTALALRAAGHRVVGVEISPARRRDIAAGDVDLLPEDHRRLRACLAGPPDGSFTVTGDSAALTGADAVLICVPTPVDAHRVPDLRALRAACAAVTDRARPGQTLVLASTSYVGTTRELLAEPLRRRGLTPGRDVFVACAPERVDPGTAGHAQSATPRVVGGLGPDCGRRAAAVLRAAAAGVHLVGSPEAAELTKLLENTFRAVNIALANEFAAVCGELGLDAPEVIDAAATKPFGFMPFWPGPGAGGHCIPCDPHYLLWQLRARRLPAPVTETAMAALAARPRAVVRRALDTLAAAGVRPADARVLVLGVAYKPGVADARESPALTVLDDLADAGATVAYSDPLVPEAVTPAGRVLRSMADPAAGTWDLVVAHTVHPGQDTAWPAGRAPVLDATYRLPEMPGRVVV